MDLSKLDQGPSSDTGVELTLINPDTGEKTDIILTVVGNESKRYKQAEHSIVNKRLDEGNIANIRSEDLESRGIELIAACVISWINLADKNIFPKGEPACTKENAIIFFTNHPWAKKQVDKWIYDRTNFLTHA